METKIALNIPFSLLSRIKIRNKGAGKKEMPAAYLQ